MTIRSTSAQILAAITAVWALSFAGVGARGEYTTFTGIDPGAAPGQAIPNSQNAESRFAVAATKLAPLTSPSFANMSLGSPSGTAAASIVPGVSVSLSGTSPGLVWTDQNGVKHTYIYGITDAAHSPYTAATGYSVTSGGKYLEFVPQLPVKNESWSASIDFHFQSGISAFGVYLTGYGDVGNPLSVSFNDGLNESIAIKGSAKGGAEYFGFVDPGASIHDIIFTETGSSNGSEDVFGLDGVSYAIKPQAQTVPAPSSIVLAAIAFASLAVARLGRFGSSSAFSRRSVAGRTS